MPLCGPTFCFPLLSNSGPKFCFPLLSNSGPRPRKDIRRDLESQEPQITAFCHDPNKHEPQWFLGIGNNWTTEQVSLFKSRCCCSVGHTFVEMEHSALFYMLISAFVCMLTYLFPCWHTFVEMEHSALFYMLISAFVCMLTYLFPCWRVASCGHLYSPSSPLYSPSLIFSFLTLQKLALEVNAKRAVHTLNSSATEDNKKRVRDFRDILQVMPTKMRRHNKVITAIDTALGSARRA